MMILIGNAIASLLPVLPAFLSVLCRAAAACILLTIGVPLFALTDSLALAWLQSCEGHLFCPSPVLLTLAGVCPGHDFISAQFWLRCKYSLDPLDVLVGEESPPRHLIGGGRQDPALDEIQ